MNAPTSLITSLIAGSSLLVISACQSLNSKDPSSLAFSIPDGSALILEKPLKIPAGRTHALLQDGKAVDGKNEYEINCRFELKDFGPRIIEPESFIITRTEDGYEWFSEPTIMRYYTEIYLDSTAGTDVIKLDCQTWGSAIDRNFTVSELQTALGEYFSFRFNFETH